MILDELLEFADATALATGTGAAQCGDVIDLGAVPQDFGLGKAMYLVVQVTTAVTSAGAATVQFELVSDAAASMTVATASRHIMTEAIGKASLVAGYGLVFSLPPNGGPEPYERYLGIVSTVGTAALTAGAINAFLTFDPQYWKSYADAAN